MSKSSNTTRSGGGSTARIVNMSQSSNNAQNNLNTLQSAQNQREAQTLSTELDTTEQHGDDVMSQITGYRMMGREVPQSLQAEYDRTQQRLKMISRRYKQLTGEDLGY